jgi:hypothetical protein
MPSKHDRKSGCESGSQSYQFRTHFHDSDRTGRSGDAVNAPASAWTAASGVLVVFDRRPEAAPIADRTAFAHSTSPSGCPVTVLRG